MRSDWAAKDLLALIPSHPRDAAACKWRISQNGPALLGHSDLETTLNVYTHTVSDSQRNAVERVAGVLFSDVLSSATAAVSRGRLN